SIRQSSHQVHNVAVQGPNSRELLSQIIWTPEHQPTVEKLAWFHFTLGRLDDAAGIPVMVSRTGYTGELGFEVWCHPAHAEQVWDAIWQAGQTFNIAPMGFEALDMLRIEAGLIFAQHEFDAQINPFEAGIGFTVPLKTKEDDFIGKQAIQNQNPASRHKLVGLILDKTEAATHGDLVYNGRFPVGVVTSATNSPTLGKQIALCRIAPQHAAVGTEIEIGKLDGQQKRLKATIVSLPFYDPERTRVRS
ncbi:MAG: aminomethyltransferase family protein, partial [Acinetobacter sp.]